MVPLLAAALLARLVLAAAQDLTRTESWSVGRATAACASVVDVARTARAVDVHPPLYYAALYGLERLVGFRVFLLKAFHAAAAVLVIALLWGWVREAAGSGAAFWSAFLAAASGYHLMLSVQMRMYMLNAVFVTAACWTAWRWWHGPGAPRRTTLAVHALALAAALHTHYYALFAWAAILTATASESLRRSSRRRAWWAAQAAVLAVWIPWAAWGLAHQLSQGRTATVSPAEEGWVAALAAAPLQFFVMNVRATSPATAAAAGLFVAAGYVCALRRAPRAAAGSWVPFLAILAAVPLWLAAAYSLWRRPIWGLHYAVVAFPAFCALAGTGVSRLPRAATLAGGLCYLAAGAIALPAVAAQGNPDYRRAAALLRAQGGPDDAIVVNAMTHSGEGLVFFLRAGGFPIDRLAFYAVHEDPTYDGLPWLTRWRAWDDPEAAAAEAASRLAALRARHPRVWFMNFSHADGAYAALEREIARRWPQRREVDLSRARLVILEGTPDGR